MFQAGAGLTICAGLALVYTGMRLEGLTSYRNKSFLLEVALGTTGLALIIIGLMTLAALYYLELP